MSSGSGTELLAFSSSNAGVIQKDSLEAEAIDLPTRHNPNPPSQIMIIPIPVELQLKIFKCLVGDEIRINERHEFIKDEPWGDEKWRIKQEQEDHTRKNQERRHNSENILLLFPNLKVEGALQYSTVYGFYDKLTPFTYICQQSMWHESDDWGFEKLPLAYHWKSFRELSKHRLEVRRLLFPVEDTSFDSLKTQKMYKAIREFRRLANVSLVFTEEASSQWGPLLESEFQKWTKEFEQNRKWNMDRVGSDAGAEDWSVPEFSVKIVYQDAP